MRKVVRGIIVKKEKGLLKYLLMNSKRDFGEFTGYYYPVGGGIEEGESQEGALKREFKEELNLIVQPDHFIATTPADFPDQEIHWWMCDFISGELEVLDENILDVGFFSQDEMKKMNIGLQLRVSLRGI